MTEKYRLIDHTADTGIQIFGKDPEDLFSNAAFALFDLITDRDAVKGENKKKIAVTGSDWPDLMVNWLRELLYLWNGKELLVLSAKIQNIAAGKIVATLWYDKYDPNRHVIKNEIKAVTYHQVQVSGGPAGWEARIIIDV